MAAPTTTDAWDEYVTKVTNGEVGMVDTWRIGLYDDSTDGIAATDDGDPDNEITTEPSGSGYAEKSITPSTGSTAVADAGDWQHDVDDQTWSGLSFDTATTVDAWYMSISVQLDGDAGAVEHLMAVGSLTGAPYDLQNYTDFTVQDIGVRQTQG